MLPSLASVLLLAAGVLSLLIALGFFGFLAPAFDSVAHFRAHLAVLLGLAALLLIAVGLWREGLLAFVLVLAALGSVWVGTRPGGSRGEGGPSYRLLQLNLLFDNAQPALVLDLIRREKPDILLLEEISARWESELAALKDVYPYSFLCRPPEGDGVAVFSRRPFAAARPPACFERRLLAVAAVDLDGWRLDCAALHLAWPWPYAHPQEITDLTGGLGELGPDAILTGDLNAVPWSTAARRVARAGGLTILRGIGATWIPLKLPEIFRFAGLPIDQVMVKGAVAVHSVSRLPPAGSDHLPLLVEFSRKVPN